MSMNQDFDDIDGFLKARIQESHFAVNEAHWQDALRRLDKGKDKKRPWFLLPIFLVLISGGVFGLYQFAQGNKTPVGDAQKNAYSYASMQQSTSAGSANAENNEAEDVTIVQQAEIRTQPQVLNEGSESPNAYAANGNSLVGLASDIKEDINQKIREDRALESKQVSQNSLAQSADFDQPEKRIPSKQKIRTAKKLVGTNKTMIAQAKNTQEDTKGATSNSSLGDANSFARTNSSTTQVKNNKTAQPINTSKDKQGTRSSETLVAIQDASSLKKSEDLVASISPSLPSRSYIKTVYKSPAEMQALNPRYIAGLEKYEYLVTEIDFNPNQAADFKAQKEAEASSESSSKPDEPFRIVGQEPVQRDITSFFLFAGASAAKGYQGNVYTKSVYGLSPNLGFGYQWAVHNKVNLYFSLFASYLNHLNITETNQQVSYSFDKITKEVEVARKNLIQLHLPVTVGFRINERHSFLGGVGLTYGANTLSTVKGNDQNLNEFGYMRGLRTLDANVQAGYEFKINDAFRVNLLFQEGLFDITKNSYFNINTEDRNRRISLGVRYNFIKR